jgi:hypothetical protein
MLTQARTLITPPHAAKRATHAPRRGSRHPALLWSAAALTRHALTILGTRSG